MLHADNVSFAYGRLPGGRLTPLAALSDVTARVARGGLLGILGPNGSGKTTLLRVMAGTLTPLEGTVTLDGVPLKTLPRRDIARRIAVVPQETRLAFDYTVLEIVLMGRYPHLGTFELEGPRDLAIAREALAATDTAAFERRPFATLSGGEKQRVVLASALAQSADLLLLDEPTSSLDLRYQLEIADILAHLNRERGVTMVISTHDLNFAAGLCRDLVLLKNGGVLAAGRTEEVLTPASIEELYGVVAEVRPHETARHLMVTPIRRRGSMVR